MILQSSGAIGTQRWYVSAYVMANQTPVGLLFLAEDWSCCRGTTLGPPVFPLAFARASALSWPQDLDLAGPRYRRQAVCFSRTSEDTTRGRNREHVSFNQKSSCLHLCVLNSCLWTQTEAQCTHTGWWQRPLLTFSTSVETFPVGHKTQIHNTNTPSDSLS